MLKRLRRKFIAIVMVLVGAVLISVLASAFLSSMRTQQDLIDVSLARALNRRMEDLPEIGLARPMEEEDDQRGKMFAVLVEANESGVIIEVSDAPVVINTDTLNEVVDTVVAGEASGRLESLHVAWNSNTSSDGTLRIAIVDTSDVDEMVSQQLVNSLQITFAALIVLFGISWWLSAWALKPVEKAWEQQQRFVADASHELKTPLAVIIANTQILEKDEALSPDLLQWVKSTADESAHMKSLINDLLTLARADESASGAASKAMRTDELCLSDLVEEATLEFEVVAFERGCELEATVEPDLKVEGDAEWLQRVVRILLDNACKYGAVGSTVKLKLEKHGKNVQMSVNNRGNVIDPEDLKHIFDRFYRSDKARSRSDSGGFGLGLAIAKGVVEAHGGRISATSTEDAGTTFTIVL